MTDQSSGFDPRTIRRLVSVHYYGRSGSLFLQSLLDDHPDILMFPADYLAGFRIFWDQFGDLAASDLMAAFLGNYEILFDVDSTDKVIGVGQFLGQDYDFAAMGPGRDERLEVDRQDFTVALIRALSFEVDELSSQQVSRKFFFQALHVAYAEALGRDFQSPDPIIVFQAHNLDVTVIDRLFEDFYPHYRFLHTVREPIQTLASWYQHMFGESASAVLELVEIALGRGLDHAKPILSHYYLCLKRGDGAAAEGDSDIVDWDAENSAAVRLEDLHLAPRATLERLSRWLDIPWHEALMHSTFAGRSWHWTTGGRTLSGFQRHTISDRHSTIIAPFDRFRLRFLFADKFAAWGYQLPGGYHWPVLRLLAFVLWLLPFRMEARLWTRLPGEQPLPSPGAKLVAYARLRRVIIRDWWRDRRQAIPLLRVL